MDPQKLDDRSLLNKTAEIASEERKLTLQFLHHLKEIESRRLYLKQGFSSLFEYVKSLGYCDASTQIRISSMRMLKELPEIESKIKEGSLSWSVVAQAQSFFRREQKATCQKMRPEAKREILNSLEGKSKRQTEQVLLSMSSKPEVHLKEKKKVVTFQHLEYSFFADPALQEQLEKIRGVLGHAQGEMNMTELVHFMAEITWQKLNPGREPDKRRANSLRPGEVKNRAPSSQLKRQIWKRDQGRCTHQDPKTGMRCASCYKLELDHYPIPFAKGGPTSEENLRLACKNHNSLHAVQSYGLQKMKEYWKN
jgi:hypothetical protein